MSDDGKRQESKHAPRKVKPSKNKDTIIESLGAIPHILHWPFSIRSSPLHSTPSCNSRAKHKAISTLFGNPRLMTQPSLSYAHSSDLAPAITPLYSCTHYGVARMFPNSLFGHSLRIARASNPNPEEAGSKNQQRKKSKKEHWVSIKQSSRARKMSRKRKSIACVF